MTYGPQGLSCESKIRPTAIKSSGRSSAAWSPDRRGNARSEVVTLYRLSWKWNSLLAMVQSSGRVTERKGTWGAGHRPSSGKARGGSLTLKSMILDEDDLA